MKVTIESREILPAHAGQIAPTSPGIQRQLENETRRRSDRISHPKILDLIFRPGDETLTGRSFRLNVARRIIVAQARLDGVLH